MVLFKKFIGSREIETTRKEHISDRINPRQRLRASSGKSVIHSRYTEVTWSVAGGIDRLSRSI
jgi:hypothetical protein